MQDLTDEMPKHPEIHTPYFTLRSFSGCSQTPGVSVVVPTSMLNTVLHKDVHLGQGLFIGEVEHEVGFKQFIKCS